MSLRLRFRKLSQSRILAIGFAVLILTGTILLMLPVSSRSGEWTGFTDCLFTATSATCVTGLTVFDTGTYWSVFGQVVIITLIQIGGLGFMSVTTIVFLILGKRLSVKNKMLLQSSFNLDTAEGIAKYVRTVIVFTLSVEGIGAALLFTRFIKDYDFVKALCFSVFHSISAFCNAGFDLIGNGMGFTGYTSSPIINLVISALIIIGGIGFTVAMDVMNTKNLKKLQFNSKIVLSTTVILLFTGFITIFIAEYNNPHTMASMTFGEKVLTALFASVTPRTAGFFSIDYSKITPITYLVTVILMFIGGSAGSTAGGIKTGSLAVILIAVYRTIKGQDDLNIFGRRISEQNLRKAFVIAFLPVLWIVFTVILLLATHPLSLNDILFETVSAIATVGLTTGITGQLNVFGKILIALSMFFGRVGIMTIAYAITKKRDDINKDHASFRYPEGNIML